MPEGLKECEKLERPIFTPSTKAEQGEHDENIHPDKCTSQEPHTTTSPQPSPHLLSIPRPFPRSPAT